MPGDGVLEGDNQVVEGARPASGAIVPGEGEAGDHLPVVEVALQVKGEPVNLVKGAQKPFGTRGTTDADKKRYRFRIPRLTLVNPLKWRPI